jgi:hypothetical protein
VRTDAEQRVKSDQISAADWAAIAEHRIARLPLHLPTLLGRSFTHRPTTVGLTLYRRGVRTMRALPLSPVAFPAMPLVLRARIIRLADHRPVITAQDSRARAFASVAASLPAEVEDDDRGRGDETAPSPPEALAVPPAGRLARITRLLFGRDRPVRGHPEGELTDADGPSVASVASESHESDEGELMLVDAPSVASVASESHESDEGAPETSSAAARLTADEAPFPHIDVGPEFADVGLPATAPMPVSASDTERIERGAGDAGDGPSSAPPPLAAHVVFARQREQARGGSDGERVSSNSAEPAARRPDDPWIERSGDAPTVAPSSVDPLPAVPRDATPDPAPARPGVFSLVRRLLRSERPVAALAERQADTRENGDVQAGAAPDGVEIGRPSDALIHAAANSESSARPEMSEAPAMDSVQPDAGAVPTMERGAVADRVDLAPSRERAPAARVLPRSSAVAADGPDAVPIIARESEMPARLVTRAPHEAALPLREPRQAKARPLTALASAAALIVRRALGTRTGGDVPLDSEAVSAEESPGGGPAIETAADPGAGVASGVSTQIAREDSGDAVALGAAPGTPVRRVFVDRAIAPPAAASVLVYRSILASGGPDALAWDGGAGRLGMAGAPHHDDVTIGAGRGSFTHDGVIAIARALPSETAPDPAVPQGGDAGHTSTNAAIETLAHDVYGLLRRRLITERERSGMRAVWLSD